MSWAWFDRCDQPAPGVIASAPVWTADGARAGFFCAWDHTVAQPSSTASKIDGRAIDAQGGPGWVSLVLAPPGLFLPFDDPAVAHATRMVLSMAPAAVVSTLVEGDDRCRGAFTGERERSGRLADDPFATLFPAVTLRVEAGFLGHIPAPTGPSTQRYGGGNPWPWDRFDEPT